MTSSVGCLMRKSVSELGNVLVVLVILKTKICPCFRLSSEPDEFIYTWEI